MSEKHYVSFQIRGDAVMGIAREKFYRDNDLPYAIRLLMDCMVTDQLSPGDRLAMAIKILDGRMAMTGTYPIDFDIVEVEPKDTRYDFEGHFKAMRDKIENLENQIRSIRDDFIFVAENLDETTLRNLDRQYRREFKKPLFPDMDLPGIPCEDADTTRLNIIDSFIKQAEWERDNPDETEYGWLAPDGTFYPAEFAEHVEWAAEHVQKLYEQAESEETRLHIRANSPDDYLRDLGWVLLHNPFRGLAQVSASDIRPLTDKQCAFLFDYYTKRGEDALASKYIVAESH